MRGVLFRVAPYTYLKAKLYHNASIILVYAISGFDFSPNVITAFYIATSILAALLISSSIKVAIILGSILFVFKNILDWTDGTYARLKGFTSMKGHIYDCYGGLISQVCFRFGLGIYLFNSTQDVLYLITGFISILSITLPISRYASDQH